MLKLKAPRDSAGISAGVRKRGGLANYGRIWVALSVHEGRGEEQVYITALSFRACLDFLSPLPNISLRFSRYYTRTRTTCCYQTPSDSITSFIQQSISAFLRALQGTSATAQILMSFFVAINKNTGRTFIPLSNHSSSTNKPNNPSWRASNIKRQPTPSMAISQP